LSTQVPPKAVAQGGGAAVPVGNGDVDGDGTINITDPIYLLNWLFTAGPAPVPIESAPCDSCCPPVCPPEHLPATGQTECYGLVEGQGWVVVPCEGAENPGQDGAYQAGCPTQGRFVDNGDGTVTDTCTGLMWQKETADVNGDGTVSPDWNGGDAVTWVEALAYCEGLSFAGHEDWRLPNVRELQSIVDYGRVDPAIDPVFGAFSRDYWSSSTYAYDPGGAWGVYFYGGYVSTTTSGSSTSMSVPCVADHRFFGPLNGSILFSSSSSRPSGARPTIL
jgi:hypothetical protein